jgi:hypothetical protein
VATTAMHCGALVWVWMHVIRSTVAIAATRGGSMPALHCWLAGLAHLLKPRLAVVYQMLQDLVDTEEHCESREDTADEPRNYISFVVVPMHLPCRWEHSCQHCENPEPSRHVLAQSTPRAWVSAIYAYRRTRSASTAEGPAAADRRFGPRASRKRCAPSAQGRTAPESRLPLSSTI